MSWIKLLKEHSALANALDLVGDRWTLMILSGCLVSVWRFNEFEKALGINRNLLSARLTKLIDAGLLEKRLYQKRPARYEYHITDIGRELRPVLVGLTAWSEKHITKNNTPISMVHEKCGSKLAIQIFCPHCERIIEDGDVVSRLNPDAGDEIVKVYRESRSRVFISKEEVDK